MKNSLLKTLIILTLAAWIIVSSNQVIALEASKSATSSSDLGSKLKTLQEGIASKAAQLKNEITKKLQNKAYIGTVKNIDNSTLVISTLSEDKKIKLMDYTDTAGKGITSVKQLKVNDEIAALGDVDENNILTAKRIVKLNSSTKSSKDVLIGKISEITKTQMTLEEKPLILSITKNTLFKKTESKLSLKDFSKGDLVVITAKKLSGNGYEAITLYLVTKAQSEPSVTQSATSSATTATKSASPTVSIP